MMILKIAKSIVLFPVWLTLAAIGAIIHLFLSVAGIVQGILSFGLVVLTCAVVLVYRDWVQAAFLICILAILMIVMFAGAFVEEMANGIRDRVMDAM